MTIEEKMSEIISKKLEDGTIEKIVEEKLTAAIDDSIGNIFKWGDGEKAIKEKLSAVIVPAIERHDFNGYMLKLDSVLTDIINNTNLADNKHILECFGELMTEPDFKEIKLSTIFEQYKEYVAENVSTDGLEAFNDGGELYYESVDVTVDVERDTDHYFRSSYEHAKIIFRCGNDDDGDLEYTVHLYKNTSEEKWRFYSSELDKSLDVASLKNLSDFDILLMNLSRAFVDVEMDIDTMSDEVTPDETPEYSLI